MKEFNFDEALEMVKQGHPVDGKDGIPDQTVGRSGPGG
jgi:hypothetical protein